MYRSKLLVVANQTVDSDELFDALRDRAQHGPIRVTLLVPQDRRERVGSHVRAAQERLRDAGIETEVIVGDADPVCAVLEIWDPRRWDAVVVSTWRVGASGWLRTDVPRRIRRAADARVIHVESRPPRPELVPHHPPPRPHESALSGVIRTLADTALQPRG